MPWFAISGLTRAALEGLGGRYHTCIAGRYVTVAVHPSRATLHCFDSTCHHAGGPLGIGDIEDVEGIACVRCPWHNFLFTLEKGDRVTQDIVAPLPKAFAAAAPTFPPRPWPPECLGPPQRGGRVEQRVHPIRWIGPSPLPVATAAATDIPNSSSGLDLLPTGTALVGCDAAAAASTTSSPLSQFTVVPLSNIAEVTATHDNDEGMSIRPDLVKEQVQEEAERKEKQPEPVLGATDIAAVFIETAYEKRVASDALAMDSRRGRSCMFVVEYREKEKRFQEVMAAAATSDDPSRGAAVPSVEEKDPINQSPLRPLVATTTAEQDALMLASMLQRRDLTDEELLAVASRNQAGGVVGPADVVARHSPDDEEHDVYSVLQQVYDLSMQERRETGVAANSSDEEDDGGPPGDPRAATPQPGQQK